MAVYTVHAPPASGAGQPPAPERFLFVRDGYYVWAVVFGPLWLAFHRLWLALVGFVALTAALHGALALTGRVGLIPFSLLLVALLLGLEGGSLRRWTLSRNGWRNLGVVVADSRDEAERRFFAAWERRAPDLPPRAPEPPAAPSSWRSPPPDVIGLFPQPGVPR